MLISSPRSTCARWKAGELAVEVLRRARHLRNRRVRFHFLIHHLRLLRHLGIRFGQPLGDLFQTGFLRFGESFQKLLVQRPRRFDCILECLIMTRNFRRVVLFPDLLDKGFQFRAGNCCALQP